MLKNPKQLKFISPLNIPNGKSGRYEIGHKLHPAGEPVTAISMRAAIFTGQKSLSIVYNGPVVYTVLAEDGSTWMTDVPAEQVSQHAALMKCKGRVLVGGLGVGYFAKKLQEKKNVTNVVVVEISQNVIDLVWKYLRLDNRFSIMCADIKKYLKGYTSNRKFDWVYLDTWRADSEYEFIDNVLPLKRLAYKMACNKVDHVLSWQEDVMLGQLQQGLTADILVRFREIISMSAKRFDTAYEPNNKYTITRRIFWRFVRENKLNTEQARIIILAYMAWIQNGMQGEFGYANLVMVWQKEELK